MRFLLYNIRYGTGGVPGRGPFQFFRPTHQRLDEIIEFIRGVDPDVAGLVEVDAGSYRSRRGNQARLIAESLGHYHAYRSKYAIDSLAQRMPVMRKQGNAFVVRDANREVRCHYFRRGIKRLVFELELPGVVIFLVHLALGGRVRLHQLQDLYQLVRQVRKPLIVAGDFNVFWGAHEIALFRAACGMQSADALGRPTWPSWHPRRQLDFILHSPDIVIDRFDVLPTQLSDHLPLVCEFHVETILSMARPVEKKTNRDPPPDEPSRVAAPVSAPLLPSTQAAPRC